MAKIAANDKNRGGKCQTSAEAAKHVTRLGPNVL